MTSSYDGSPFNIEVTFDQPLEKLEQWTGESSSDDQKYDFKQHLLKIAILFLQDLDNHQH